MLPRLMARPATEDAEDAEGQSCPSTLDCAQGHFRASAEGRRCSGHAELRRGVNEQDFSSCPPLSVVRGGCQC